jgi:hypothetical protein
VPQVTIYLESAVAEKMKRAAKADGKSVSKWVAERVDDGVRGQWSQEVLDACGAFKDFPLAEEIRAAHGRDVPREKL